MPVAAVAAELFSLLYVLRDEAQPQVREEEPLQVESVSLCVESPQLRSRYADEPLAALTMGAVRVLELLPQHVDY
jgi:hypothetical protein